jgi:hypothetical protein
MKELHEYQLMDIAVQQCIIAKILDDFGVPHGPFSETPWYPHGLPGRSYGPSLGRRGLGCGRHSLPRLGKNLSISSFHHLCIFSYIPVLPKKKGFYKKSSKTMFFIFFPFFYNKHQKDQLFSIVFPQIPYIPPHRGHGCHGVVISVITDRLRGNRSGVSSLISPDIYTYIYVI